MTYESYIDCIPISIREVETAMKRLNIHEESPMDIIEFTKLKDAFKSNKQIFVDALNHDYSRRLIIII